MVIHFCDKCGARIAQADLDAGQAKPLEEGHAVCAKCAGARVASGSTGALPPAVASSRRDPRHAPGSARQDTKVSARSRPHAGKFGDRQDVLSVPELSRRGPDVAATPSSSRLLLLIGAGVVVVSLILVGILLAIGSGEAPKPSRTGPEAKPVAEVQPATEPARAPGNSGTDKTSCLSPNFPTTPAEPAKAAEKDYDPRAAVAASLLEQARDFQRQHPEDPWKYRDKLKALASGYTGTPAGEEAAKLLATLSVPERPPDPELPPEDAWKNAVDLLPLVNLDRDTINGQWTMKDGVLLCSQERIIRIALPYLPPAEYDVRVSFTRTSGEDCLCVNLVHAGHPFTLMLGGWKNTVAGFETILSKRANTIQSNVKQGPILENGRRHVVIVQVRKDRLRAYLDGRLLLERKANLESLTAHSEWAIPRSDGKQLGLGGNESTFEIHQVQVLERTGKGQVVADAQVAENTPNSAKPPDTPPPVVDPKADYAVLLSGVQALLCQKGWPLALARLEEAAKDPKFAGQDQALALDRECVTLAEKAWQAVPKGAATLTDGRAFVLQESGGKRTEVGGGAPATVRKVEGEVIQLEQKIGGGRLGFALPLSKLTFDTSFALAGLGLPPGGESRLALALMKFPFAREAAEQSQPEKEFQQLLVQAAREGAPAGKVAHVRGWLEFVVRERAARRAFDELEVLVGAGDVPKAKAAREAYAKEYGGTACCAEHREQLKEFDARLARLDLQPGWWASYWAGDGGNPFKQLVLSRADFPHKATWYSAGPDPRIPKERFGILFAGLLRITQRGKYTFALQGDDMLKLWIDDKAIGETKWDTGRKSFDVELEPGDHSVRLRFANQSGGASMTFEFTPPGETKSRPVPREMLFHDPRKAAEYQRP